jgi:hypothetical protein
MAITATGRIMGVVLGRRLHGLGVSSEKKAATLLRPVAECDFFIYRKSKTRFSLEKMAHLRGKSGSHPVLQPNSFDASIEIVEAI